MTIAMRDALALPTLLGGILDGPSWQLWRAMLIAANGEALDDDERELFAKFTGREREPLEPVEELWAIVGRRGGKSRAAAVLALFHACFVDHSKVLVTGETGVVLVLALNTKQAAVVFNYIVGIMEANPLLAELIENQTAESVELTNGITIEVRAASFRGLRGATAVAVIADEAAFWYAGDTGSVNAAEEIFDAVRPALGTTGGPLIVISSPYAKMGAVWDTYSKHFGPKGDPLILVCQGSSKEFNPSLKQRVVDRAYEKDPVSAAAEYGGQFRNDVGTYLRYELIEAAIDYGVTVRPPSSDISYVAYFDAASGTGQDSAAGVIAYAGADGECVVALVFESRPPFSPNDVIAEFSKLAQEYGVSTVHGDAYAAGFVVEAFDRCGITYAKSERDTSGNYIECVAAFTTGRVRMPENKRLISQFAALQRFTSITGRDRVNHPRDQHDDLSAAAAGAIALVAGGDDAEIWRRLADKPQAMEAASNILLRNPLAIDDPGRAALDDHFARVELTALPLEPVAPLAPHQLRRGEIFVPPSRPAPPPLPDPTCWNSSAPPTQRFSTGAELLHQIAMKGF